MPRCHICLLILVSIIMVSLTGCSDEVDPVGDIDYDVPFPVTDLAITVRNDTTLLTWTATGDDGPNGTATRYDLRMHTEGLTPENWNDATALDGPPNPGPAGTPEQFILATTNAALPTRYYALKVVDDQGNRSKMSNVAFVDLHPPAAVTDLVTGRVTDSYTHLSWTSPADDGPRGYPTRYEIGLSTEMLTVDNWADAPPKAGPSKPAPAGENQPFNLIDIEPQTRYYAAVRSRDEAGNLSDISNVVEFQTPARPLGWWDGFASLQCDNTVTNLHVHQDTLFVGGRFAGIGGTGSRALASYDGTGWHGYGNGLAGGPYNSFVLGMSTFGDDLYVNGSFARADGISANNIVRWTGSVFEGLGNNLAKGLPLTTQSFQGELYVSWGYLPSSSAPFDFLTRWDGSAWHSLGWVGEAGPYITGMSPYQGGLLMIGNLKGVAGLTTQSVILWDGNGYTPVGPDLAGGIMDVPVPYSSCEFDGDLYVGGVFSHAGGVPVNNIARWDGAAWHSLSGGVAGVNARIDAMVAYKGYLVVAGHFETAGGRIVNNIARWDGGFWEPMGTGLEGPDLNFVSGAALEVYQGSLYVGGTFTTVDGNPSPYLARWDLD